MDNMMYMEKELAIFDGIITLIKNGSNVYSITVSEIARSANVGKGTIYDYFDTKEEAISKAILYNIDKEIEYAIDRISLKNGFKDRYYEILNIVAENLQSKFCTINMLLSAGGFQEFYEYLLEQKQDASQYIRKIEKEIDKLLEMGFEEGVISIEEDIYYRRMVIKSAISSFVGYINIKEHYPHIDMERAMDLSYKLIVKSLN
ncbi:MAG TPA: TetR/AcrR family transcriptional regulator [Tepidimicrobium sp.]|nr:TetR/AcrR family transcriptional regulator [Tepidimicrobium sp.]